MNLLTTVQELFDLIHALEDDYLETTKTSMISEYSSVIPITRSGQSREAVMALMTPENVENIIPINAITSNALEHRQSCHRYVVMQYCVYITFHLSNSCGNIRKEVRECSKCPQVFCIKCSEKIAEELTWDAFSNGCPVVSSTNLICLPCTHGIFK